MKDGTKFDRKMLWRWQAVVMEDFDSDWTTIMDPTDEESCSKSAAADAHYDRHRIPYRTGVLDRVTGVVTDVDSFGDYIL